MESDDLRSALIEKLENLNKVMPQHRKATDEMKQLKAEVATLNAKLAATDAKVSSAEFGHLVEKALFSW